MTTSGHQKLIAGAILGNGDSLLGRSDFEEWHNAEQPRFSSKSASQDAHSTESTGKNEEHRAAQLAKPASPRKPSGEALAGGSNKGDRTAKVGDRHAAYWNKLKKITVVWMLAWTVPAIIMHLPISVTRQVTILNGIPLHWFNAAFLAIVTGIALIFMYAYVMERTDRAFKED